MPTTSALDLITRSLRVIGELAGEETPTASQAADGLSCLQDLMDTFRTQRLMIPSLLRTVVPLSANTPAYTIGTGGQINIARPETIEYARLIQNAAEVPPIEVPVHILSDQEWVAVRQKSLATIYAQAIYFDHAWHAGLGTIYLFPVPTIGPSTPPLPTPFPPTVVPIATRPLTNEQPYGYCVTAINLYGETDASAEVVVSANLGLSTSGTIDYNAISWAAVPGATAYRVYRTRGVVGPTWAQPPALIATVSAAAPLVLNDAAIPGTVLAPPLTNTTQGPGALTQLVLYTPVAFPEFADLAMSYSFPAGWTRALRLQLARDLAPEFGRAWSPELEDQAVKSMADVKRVNFRARQLSSDYPDASLARRHVYNILSDL